MSENINEAELGRSKQAVTPAEHLQHLLSIGWDPNSPLIRKYVRENNLDRQLQELLAKNKK